MSDSDSSDYNVDDYVKPDTIRHTYNNEDVISDHEEESNSSSAETESDESDSEIKNPQCKVNGNGVNEDNEHHEEERIKTRAEPEKSNSRYILYVTNLSGETTRTMLEDFFADAGQIKSIRIPRVRLGNFAFVEMKDIEGYKAGLKYNNKELDSRKIQVYEGSKNKKHTSTKSKNLKRKTQQQHLSNIKMKKKNLNE